MAADYQTGSASSPSDLLQTLHSWLVAQGWTSDSSAVDGSGRRAHLHKSGQYVNFRAASNEKIWQDVPSGLYDAVQGYGIGFYLGTGYSGAAAWDKQAGGPTRPNGATIGAGMNLPSGSITAYHFFDDGNDNIVVVVEKAPGVFVWMVWGPELEEAGNPSAFWNFAGSSSSYFVTYVGSATNVPGETLTGDCPFVHSQYQQIASVFGVASNCFVRVDAGTFAGLWISNGSFDTNNFLYAGRFMRCPINPTADSTLTPREFINYGYLYSRVKQTAYPGSLLLPLHLSVLTDPAGRWAPIGINPAVFYSAAVGNGFAAGEVYQIGGQDYMVFPNFAVLKAA